MSVIFTAVFILALLYHSYTDMKDYLLYDKVTCFLAGAGLARALHYGILTDSLAGAAALLAVMLAIYFASRGGMGEGDVKLAAALGVWLGVEQGLACLLLAFVGGGAVGMVLLACGERRRMIPFGPFLCAAAAMAYFWGREILEWYWYCIPLCQLR